MILGTVIVMERMVVVSDPVFGTIAGVIDADGSVVSTAADTVFERPNLQPYIQAADLAARELAALYAREHPEHAQWLEQRFWDDCIAEGGAR